MIPNHQLRRLPLRRITASILLAAALLLALPYGLIVRAEPELSAGATENESTDADQILYGIAPGVLTAQMSLQIDMFNDETVTGWRTAYETTGLSAESVLPWEKCGAFEGERCLVLSTENYSTYGGMNIERSFLPNEQTGDDYLDFGRASYFVTAVCAPDVPGRTYTVTVTLLSAMISASTSGNFLQYSQQFSVTGGEWAVLLCDISGFEGKAEIQRISIKITADDAAYGSSVSAAVDALGICTDEKLTAALRFLSSACRAENGILSAGEQLVLSAGGTDPALCIDTLNGLVFPESCAVRMCLSNSTACRSVFLYYTMPDGKEYFSAAVEIAASPGIQYAYFPMPEGTVSSLRFVFNGELTGDVTIYGIRISSYYSSGVEELGNISACEIGENGTALRVAGTLDSTVSEKYRSASVGLYELEMYQDEQSVLSGNARLLSEQPAGKSFTFSVSVDAGDHSFLTKKYAVVLSCSDGLLPIDTAKYITNPEVLSGSSVHFPETESKKGTVDALSRDATDGVRHTYLEVRLEKLLSDMSAGYMHETDGVRYYYDRAYLEELDGKIRALTGRGIAVALVLTASYTGNSSIDRTLLWANTDAETEYGAFNTGTQTGIRCLRAVCDMLSSRYGKENGEYGSVVRYVVGKNVENAAEHYSMGPVTLADFSARYADAVRIVYNTVKANSAEARVYVSLGSTWNAGITPQQRYRFDSRSVLDVLAAKIQAEGDFGWNVAFDPYPAKEAYYSCLDRAAGSDAEASYVSFANLEVLTDYLQRKSMYCGGSLRSVLLLEQYPRETDAEDEEESMRRGADYAYAYYKLSMKSYSFIEALIISHQADYRETLRYIDTSSSASVTAYALTWMGMTDWREAIPSFELSRAVRRSLKTGVGSDAVPADARGSMQFLLFDGSGYAAVWGAEENCGEPGSGTVVSGHGTVLTVGLNQTENRDGSTFRAVFEKPVDLSFCPYLKTELLVSSLPQETESVDVSFILGAGDSYITVQKRVKADTWTTFVADVSVFDGLKNCDSLRIRITSEEGKEIGNASVMLGAVSLVSSVYDDAELAEAFRQAQYGQMGTGTADYTAQRYTRAVIALILVMLAAFTAEVFHVLSRRRKSQN